MKKLNKNEEILLEFIAKKSEVSVGEIVEGTSIVLRTVQRGLKKLLEANRIAAFGTTRDRVYRRVFDAKDTLMKLVVFSSGVMIGELHFGQGEYTFSYEDSYKGDALEGLKKGVLNRSVELFAYFENLIPEYERRDRILEGAQDIAEVLSHLKNAHGAIDFVEKEKLFEYKPNYGARKNWISVKNKILGTNEFPNLVDATIEIADEILDATTNTEHSDLSGYQTKVDVDFDREKNLIVESKNAAYLLKPRNKHKSNYFNSDEDTKKRYYPFIAINEHMFMSFAKNELGFDVPFSGIIKAKDVDYHYLTKRYDRIDSLKYNQQDFAQILDVQSKDKYKSSSEELFEALNKKLSLEEAKLDALMFYYYSYLIKHADLHLKNIGALEIGMKKYILAPLYDVISVGIYNGESLDLGLGMKNPYKKPKNWRLEEFYKLAKLVGISELKFKKRARELTKIFLLKMPEYIEKLKEFEKSNPLKIQKTRVDSHVDFSKRVQSMFDKRVVKLKKLGIISELELSQEAGGLLNAQKNSKSESS